MIQSKSAIHCVGGCDALTFGQKKPGEHDEVLVLGKVTQARPFNESRKLLAVSEVGSSLMSIELFETELVVAIDSFCFTLLNNQKIFNQERRKRHTVNGVLFFNTFASNFSPLSCASGLVHLRALRSWRGFRKPVDKAQQ